MSAAPQIITIAIDGFSSCGKSTLARDLAQALGYVHIDSGAMYRAVTLYFLENGVNIENSQDVQHALGQIAIAFSPQGTTLNGKAVEAQIRSMRVNRLVSPVAAISGVRKALVAQQQHLGKDGGVVMDGRDIGTVVFPHAELKLFLTANPEVRIKRRYLELREKGMHVTREEVAESLSRRDLIDTTRADSPLLQADDAVLIDNSDLTRVEQREIALNLARERLSAAVKSS